MKDYTLRGLKGLTQILLQIENPILWNNESYITDAELSHGGCCNSSVSR